MTQPANIRKHFVDWVVLLADPVAQMKYEKDVSYAPVHTELVETFYDLYFPADASFVAAVSKEEALGLAELESLLDSAAKRSKSVGVHSVPQLQALPEWQAVVRQAKAVREVLTKEANQPPQTTTGSGAPGRV